jgi:hypothetical protein
MVDKLLNKTLIGAGCIVTGALGFLGGVLYDDETQEEFIQETVENLYEEFYSSSPNLSKDELKFLDDVLSKKDSDLGDNKKNLCKLIVSTDKLKRSSRGTCVFLTNGWVLSSYHQVEYDHEDVLERGRILEIKTSEFTISSINSKVDVVATSPRYDLALLRVETQLVNSIPATLCLDKEESKEDLYYIKTRDNSSKFDDGNKFLKGIIPEANPSGITFSSNGVHKYNYMGFEGDKHLASGDSGTPIYSSGNDCVTGVYVSRVGGKKFYSPKVAWFLNTFREKLE